jgi:hypothetical protein
MNKKLILAHVAAIYIATIGVGSAAPPDIGPVPVTVTADHFQIILGVDLENGFSATSDPFTFEDGATALIEYIACEYTHAIGNSSSDAQLELVADVYQGSESAGEATIIWPELTEYTSLVPPPIERHVSNDLVSACIGSSCESMSDVQYRSLKLRASRNQFITDPEHAECLIKGTILR